MKLIFSVLFFAILMTVTSAKAGGAIVIQPHTEEVIQAFLDDSVVKKKIASLKSQGFTMSNPSATIADTAFGDEGPEGTYLVSIYYDDGAPPWARVNGTVTGVVRFSMGFIQTVKVVDPRQAAAALQGL